MRSFLFTALLSALTGCAASHAELAPLSLPTVALPGSDGKTYDLREETRHSKALVLTFFSRTCPCQSEHDPRLVALANQEAERGVRFFSVDVDPDATVQQDADEARKRGYPFPILVDSSGAIADALGAEVATYSVVFDSSGVAHYRGGIDSDRTHLTDHPERWLQSAIEDGLGGEIAGVHEERALGCALRRK